MAAIDADAFGVMEIQNNGNVAAADLATALNARVGAGTYATGSLPADTGSDAIRVAILYKPAKLQAVGVAVSDNDPVNNRPTLAQTFALASGERFTLFVNHLKSKGSCPSPAAADVRGNTDVGDGQGCWNLLRKQQAARLRSFVAQRQAAAGSNDVLLIGDFNAYAQEDPITELTSNGYVDQIGRFDTFGYSYVFDGAAGRLDQAITNQSLSAKVSGAAPWHINADEAATLDYNLEFKAPEQRCGVGSTMACPPDPYQPTPYRASDHDPNVVGLALYRVIKDGSGRDVQTGSGSNDHSVHSSVLDGVDTITDFTPGASMLDFLDDDLASMPMCP